MHEISLAPTSRVEPMRITPYTPEHIPAVQRMNARLQAGGSDWKFYESDRPDWIPVQDCAGLGTWREFFVVEDGTGEVRGAYCLKPQRFRLAGEDGWIGTWQGPVSEGLVDNRYSLVGMLCVRHMQERYPLQFGWGNSERLVKLLVQLGWRTVQTPALVRVLRPHRFLREAAYLRHSRRNRIVLDALAWSGLGSLGIQALHVGLRLFSTAPPLVDTERVESFGDWADAVWDAARDHYSMIAMRDAATLNALMGHRGWPHAELIKVRHGTEILGWAALRVSAMEGDKRFGSMSVGSIIDSLAIPGQEAAVVGGAMRHLLGRGIDLLITNSTNARWREAFRRVGFLELANKRLMTISPALDKQVGSLDEAFLANTHLAPIDADGPFGV